MVQKSEEESTEYVGKNRLNKCLDFNVYSLGLNVDS